MLCKNCRSNFLQAKEIGRLPADTKMCKDFCWALMELAPFSDPAVIRSAAINVRCPYTAELSTGQNWVKPNED